jgi:hypothetical protein
MSLLVAKLKPSGSIGLLPLRADPFRGRMAHHPLSILAHALPRPGLSTEVNVWRLKNIPNVWRGLWRIWIASLFGIPTRYGAVFARVRRGELGAWTEYGLASLRVVTSAGVADLASRMAGTSAASIANFKFHGFGTGTTAEAAADTALVTELTTQYATDSTRPTGTQAASTNTYTTVGTLSPDADVAITEHGVFNATSTGTLWDRSKFSAVNLTGNADSFQVTYVATFPSGS